ncbi:hypothetical protein G9A89_004516 [Geosiphon pyriformis]|nr:hypothetical protein G9A89_004516 [Geosiphon pyriformis]
MTARLNPATTLKKKLEKQLENTTSINLIKSLYNTFRISSMEIAFEHQVMGIILQRTSTNNTKPKYNQQLSLNNNHYPAESAFNFYINKRITNFLGRPVDIESARENFYSKLIQHTNLLKNHSFALIIREINQKIERYTQKTFSITYQDKGKGKLQTPIVTPKRIQIPNWKKQRIESLIYPSYHHTPGSTINIASANAFTSTKTSLARITFQSKQKKNKLLGAYDNYFEGFKSKLPTLLEFQSPPHQPDFGTITNSAISSTTPTTVTFLTTSATAITTTQLRSNDGITPEQCKPFPTFSRIPPIHNFNVFKVEFLRYFSNNNSINCLVNIFTTMKQGETEAVITYLRSIDANYFTAPQILNQFIRGLCSSILQHVHPLHLGTLQDAVTCAKDFESAESETNHTQAINLVMNGSSELDSKLEKFSESINKRLEGYLADNHAIYQPLQQRNNQRNSNHSQNQLRPSSSTNQQW